MNFRLFFIATLVYICTSHSYVKVITKGSYVGYICGPKKFGMVSYEYKFQECVYIRDCMTRGRHNDYIYYARYSFKKYPLRDNYEKGIYLRCEVMCDTTSDNFYFKLKFPNGGGAFRTLAYEYVDLKLEKSTPVVNNGGYVEVHMTYIHLIWEKNIEIIFDNELLGYANVTIRNDTLRFKVFVKKYDQYSSHQASYMQIKYGHETCKVSHKIGHIVVINPKLSQNFGKMEKKLIQSIEDKNNSNVKLIKLQNRNEINYATGALLFPILIIALVISVVLNIHFGWKLKKKSKYARRDSNYNDSKLLQNTDPEKNSVVLEVDSADPEVNSADLEDNSAAVKSTLV